MPRCALGDICQGKAEGGPGVRGGSLLEDGSWAGQRDVHQTTDGQNVEGVETQFRNRKGKGIACWTPVLNTKETGGQV
ncbi:unnamed protein product [Arctogadus glacialis]